MQILVQHIKTVLPGLKTRISTALVSVAKEHASYGEITESKVTFYSLCKSGWVIAESIGRLFTFMCAVFSCAFWKMKVV